MNLSCNSVNFTGCVDKSVYNWAESLRDSAYKERLSNANRLNKPLAKKELEAIDERIDAMMNVLEAKAATMHPDTVITIDNPCKDSNRFLCVHNKQIKNRMRQTPASNSYHQPWEILDHWKVSGHKTSLSSPQIYNALELLEFLINDIDEKQTDRLLIKNVIGEVMEDAPFGTNKSLLKKIDSILKVQKDLGMNTEWAEKAYSKMKSADEKNALQKQNKTMLAEYNKKSAATDNNSGGFFSRIANWFN